jgi:hypothetical protein
MEMVPHQLGSNGISNNRNSNYRDYTVFYLLALYCGLFILVSSFVPPNYYCVNCIKPC